MDKKIIDDIVWWIPIKKLRNNIRYCYNDIIDKQNMIFNDIDNLKNKISSIEKAFTKNIIHQTVMDNINFSFYDLLLSKTIEIVTSEIDTYNFDTINFENGDIVIDIGGNIGMISIFLAKKYPFLKIFSFEPVKQNYDNFLMNIKLNNIPDGIITVENVAITSDRRNISLYIPPVNTAASNIFDRYSNVSDFVESNIESITLDDIFEKYNIEKCKLLKIDCEGSEYEILYNTNINNLIKCSHMRAEFHGTEDIQKKLYMYLKNYIRNIEYQSNNDQFYFDKELNK